MASGTFRSVVLAALIAGFSGLAPAQDRDEAPGPDDTPHRSRRRVYHPRTGRWRRASGTASRSRLNSRCRTAIFSSPSTPQTPTAASRRFSTPKAGAIISAQPITDTEHFARAKAYKAVMDKAMTSLRADRASDPGECRNSGYRHRPGTAERTARRRRPDCSDQEVS